MSIYNTPMPNHSNGSSARSRLMPGLATTAAGAAIGFIGLFLPLIKMAVEAYGNEKSQGVSLFEAITKSDPTAPGSGKAYFTILAIIVSLALSVAALANGKIGLAKGAGIACIVLGAVSLIICVSYYNDYKKIADGFDDASGSSYNSNVSTSSSLGFGFYLLVLSALLILIGGIVTMVLTGKVRAQNNFGPSAVMGDGQFGLYGQQPGVPQGGYQDPGFQQQGYPQQGGYPQQWGGQQQPW